MILNILEFNFSELAKSVARQEKMHLKSRFTCINVLFLFVLLILAAQSRQFRGDKKRDAEENEHHLLHILKDHEIIPDIIDDAAHADVLEVRIFYKSIYFIFDKCEVVFFP